MLLVQYLLADKHVLYFQACRQAHIKLQHMKHPLGSLSCHTLLMPPMQGLGNRLTRKLEKQELSPLL